MRTRLRLGVVAAIQVGLVVALIAAVASRRIPLGIPGEWEWLRVKLSPLPISLLLAGLGCAAYAGFAGLGMRSMLRDELGRWRESAWVAGLLVAATAIQVVIPSGAADEYDLTKWAYVNYFGASTGYYQVARNQAMGDPWRFLAAYPVWIQGQDSLHIGTHPPGLIALQCVLIGTMERNPELATLLMRSMPGSTTAGFRQLENLYRTPIPRADRAAIFASSLLTLLACAGTVVPLYLLAKSSMSPSASWATAALWPLVSSANLFQPDADAAYPFLSTLAMALAAWSARGSRSPLVLAALAGVTLAFGMFFTLAFLPVGLIVAILIVADPAESARRKAALILAVGVGFLMLTVAGWWLMRANPIPVWTWNLKNHARFYVEYPRSYAAWFVVNPIELAVALGLPAVAWAAVGLLRPRYLPAGFWAAFCVVVLLNVVGRNMGEVARLWLLFMPPFLLAAGSGLARLGGGPASLTTSCGLMAVQVLALQAMIQVVYPV